MDTYYEIEKSRVVERNLIKLLARGVVSSRGRPASGWHRQNAYMYFVYLLRSEVNGKSYIGFTSKEVSRRLNEHNIGSNIWTSNNRPFKIIYYESYICKADAIARENFFKSGVGKKLKKIIIENYGV